jgi:hypothetical protein
VPRFQIRQTPPRVDGAADDHDAEDQQGGLHGPDEPALSTAIPRLDLLPWAAGSTFLERRIPGINLTERCVHTGNRCATVRQSSHEPATMTGPARACP